MGSAQGSTHQLFSCSTGQYSVTWTQIMQEMLGNVCSERKRKCFGKVLVFCHSVCKVPSHFSCYVTVGYVGLYKVFNKLQALFQISTRQYFFYFPISLFLFYCPLDRSLTVGITQASLILFKTEFFDLNQFLFLHPASLVLLSPSQLLFFGCSVADKPLGILIIYS